MKGTQYRRAIHAWLLVGLSSLAGAGCGGSQGDPASGTPAGVGVELVYADAGSPRATGLARTLTATDHSRARTSVADLPDETWLRLTVEGPDFAPIVCQFPKARGGRCDGIPAGTGRSVTVEEWDPAFETLYFRGRALGVRVDAGRDTRVSVQMRPPVAIRYPPADAAVNLSVFEARVQTEPGALVDLYIDTRLAGSGRADSNGVAIVPVGRATTNADGSTGLPEGEYLLTAVAFPTPKPGSLPVRHLGAPLSFAVDLTPPILQLSGPSVSNSLAVDLAGVTEPGVVVQCGRDRPQNSLQPLVSNEGRFNIEQFPIGEQETSIVCDSTDRAGNVTEKRLVVTYLPSSFPLRAELVDVTSRPTTTLTVTSHPNITDVEVTVTGELTGTTLTVPVRRQLEPGGFSAEIPLNPNQWNHVRIGARIGVQEVGAQTLSVEHDDVPPTIPRAIGVVYTPSRAEVAGNRLYYSGVRIEFEPKDPATKVEVYEWTEQTICCNTAPDGTLTLRTPTAFVAVVDGQQGHLDLPSARCYWALGARAFDRAGNRSQQWNIFLIPPMSAFATCVR